MKITYLGHSCFIVEVNSVKFMFDPFDSKMVGLPLKKQAVDVCLTSHGHADHNHIASATGNFSVIDRVQKFSLGNIEINGFQSFHDDCGGLKRGKNIVFKLSYNDFTFVHMGDIGFVDYPLISKLQKVNALAIPVGDNYTINAELAYEYVNEIKPQVVFPMHYLTKGVKIDISSPDKFLNKFDSKQIKKAEFFDSDAFTPCDKPMIYMLQNIMTR